MKIRTIVVIFLLSLGFFGIIATAPAWRPKPPVETITLTGEVVETSLFNFTGRGWLTLRVDMDQYQTLVHVNVVGRDDDHPRTRLILKQRFVHDLLYHQVEVTAVRGRYGYFFARTIQEL